MKTTRYALLATALLGVSGVAAAAQPAQNPWFVGADYGWTTQHVSSIHDHDGDDQYSLKAGKYLGADNQHRVTFIYNNADGDIRHTNYRNRNYMVSYDYMYPVMNNANIFGGISAGVAHTDFSGVGVDNDFVYGAQVGAQYNFTPKFGAEIAYRYLDQDYHKRGVKLDDTQQAYVGLEYRF